MTHGARSNSICYICDTAVSQEESSTHLQGCIDSTKKESFLLHIKAQHADDYWLYILVPGHVTLEEVDEFLRIFWLECCGHLSAFIFGKKIFPSDFGTEAFLLYNTQNQYSMEISVGSLFKEGLKGLYDYDFGSTTTLELTVLEKVPVTSDRVMVLMQNIEPTFACDLCKKKSVLFCTICKVTSCKRCSRSHDCCAGEEYFVHLKNSPRSGTCGY